MTPRIALIGSGETEERRRPQAIPPPGMVRNPGAHFIQKIGQTGWGGGLLTAEAVEKANLLDHSIPDFCLHQSIKKHA